jgi:hypothetical protein
VLLLSPSARSIGALSTKFVVVTVVLLLQAIGSENGRIGGVLAHGVARR